MESQRILLGCNFYSVCGGIFGLTSITTMAAIALNRLGAVNDPFSSLKLGSCFTISMTNDHLSQDNSRVYS